VKPSEIVTWRLANQQISVQKFERPAQVVSWLGAVQAQDYLGGLWALGLRLPKANEAEIEKAISDRAIVRTWPMRGTLHFVAAADVRWMLKLMTPRILAAAAHRRRQFELTEAALARCGALFVKALEGGRQLSRIDMYQVLEHGKITTQGGRGLHILWQLAQQGLICFGGRRGKQHSFALLDEWVPNAESLEHDEALQRLTSRYFTGHGPATLQDFVWWSGLSVSEAKRGLEMVGGVLEPVDVGPRRYWMARDLPSKKAHTGGLHLLPDFDEYLVGYQDRALALQRIRLSKTALDGFEILSHTIVSNGQIIGLWKRVIRHSQVHIGARFVSPPTSSEKQRLRAEADRYGKFLALPAVLHPETRDIS
jgi:Winged helix DNA-binding domain